MPLEPGTRLGPYHVLEPIAAGGMGQVYQARDTRLDRLVAIKQSAAEFGARFEHEARAVAALNHPNICQLYDVGPDYLVMEFVEGRPLGPVDGTKKLLDLAVQMADGMAAAHAAGIIHRDLKPDNVFVTADGRVKILDFGLAKAIAGGDAHTRASLTGAGTAIGTVHYMSPEQARGQGTLGPQSDQFSFGLILYELVAGRKAFARESSAETLTAIIREDAAPLPATVPAPLRWIIERLLAKDPAERYDSSRDLYRELKQLRDRLSDATGALSGATPASAAATPASRVGRWLAFVAPVALVAVAAGAGWVLTRPGPSNTERLTLTIVAPEGVRMAPVGAMGSAPQLSPDGSAVLFSTVEPAGLHVRWLRTTELTRVPGSEGVSNEAFWHGSSRVSFPVRPGELTTLFDVRLPDGAPEAVMAVPSPLRGGAWLADGSVVVSGIFELLRSRDRSPTEKITLPTPEAHYPEPVSASGHFLYWRPNVEGRGEVCLATFIDGGIANDTVLFENETAARYTPSGNGRVLFVRNDNLYAQRLNLSTRALEGDAELLARGVGSQPGFARADFSVADNGTIAWRPGRAAQSQVVTFNRDGDVLGVSGRPGVISGISLSPVEPRLVLEGRASVLADAGEAAITSLPRTVNPINWLADGTLAGELATGEVVRVHRDGRQSPIGRLPAGVRLIGFVSHDGRIAFGREGQRIVWAHVSDDPTRERWTPLFDADETQTDVTMSPDARFALYEAEGVYVQPFPGPGRRQSIDPAGADPVWRADGREILYLKDDAVWAVSLSTGGGTTLSLGTPRRLFDGLRRPFSRVRANRGLAVSADGSRIYVIQAVEQPLQTDVIHVQMDVVRP